MKGKGKGKGKGKDPEICNLFPKQKDKSKKKKGKDKNNSKDEVVVFNSFTGKFIIVQNEEKEFCLAGGPDECKTPTVMGNIFLK